MPQFIKHISATGLHGRFNLELDFKEGVNIVYGSNGSGKTTLLHILANASNLDLRRFVGLTFAEIILKLSDSSEIQIVRHPESRTIQMLFGAKVIDEINSDEERFSTNPRERRLSSDRQKARRLRRNLNLTVRTTYFPAFRTMIEAWSSIENEDMPEFRNDIGRQARLFHGMSHRFNSTALARGLFGKFVPELNYPAPNVIEEHINREIRQAIFSIARTDQSLLSTAFIEAFAAISGKDSQNGEPGDAYSILKEIEELSDKLQATPIRPQSSQSGSVYEQLRKQIPAFRTHQQETGDLTTRRVLSIYEGSLRRRLKVQTEAFERVNKYVAAVNRFLEGKELVLEPGEDFDVSDQPELRVKFSDGRVSKLSTLSSGERQIVGLIYAASYIGEANVVLIDEPELSLHVDWQRMLIDEMVSQLPSKQLIVCTHSPIIGAAFPDNMVALRPSISPLSYGEGEAYLDDGEAYPGFEDIFEDLDVEEIL